MENKEMEQSMIKVLNQLAQEKTLMLVAIEKSTKRIKTEQQNLAKIKEKIELAKEILASYMVHGFIELEAHHYTYPFHYMGMCNPSKKTRKKVEKLYVSAEEAYKKLLVPEEDNHNGHLVHYVKGEANVQ